MGQEAPKEPVAEPPSGVEPIIMPPVANGAALPEMPAEVSATTCILGPIADGTPSPPSPKPVWPQFQAKRTVVRHLDVVEPPPMHGLPPVTGTITQTVQLVKDPHLPALPAPVLPVSDDYSGGPAHMVQTTLKIRETQLLFLSATVYDHSRTLLCCYPNGNSKSEITVWSNLDFNHFSGFSTFQVKGGDGDVRHYGLIMAIGNEDTGIEVASLAASGIEFDAPEIPALANGDPAYVIEGASPDPEAVQIIEDLHELYRVEGLRMEAAYHARARAEGARRAYLLANPPKPRDVIIRYWRGKRTENSNQKVTP